jgi:translation initiation factor IF-3
VYSISKEDLRINEEIRAKEVRLVSSANEQLGILPVREALRLAAEQQLDLVEVAPLAKPPVCRIMDYGKFRFEQQKREKEARKKQKIVTIKEVKVRPNIEDHDFYVKLKNAQRFLQDGDKVKATVMFRGRELSHPELGRKVLVRMAAELKDIANVERDPKLEGKNMIMILAAKQQVQQPQQTQQSQQPQQSQQH